VTKETLLIFVFAVSVITVWAWQEFRGTQPPASPSASTPPTPAHLYFKLGNEKSAIDKLTWDDIPGAVSYLSERNRQADQFLEDAKDSQNAKAAYLRGLLLLGRNQPAEAAASFRGIAAGTLPSPLLYAPWRLMDELQPQAGNPFRSAMLQAADEGAVAPLIAARVFSAQGRPDKAIESYLKTDPGAWTPHDIGCFRFLLADEASRNEAGAVLLAALKGGKLPAGPRELAARLLLAEQANQADPPKLKEFIKNNPEAATAAGRLIRSLTEDRKLFVEQKFSELLEKRRADRPEALIDESILLLTIASAGVSDTEAFGKWSRELQRRFPQPEVESWIQSLANP